MEESNLTRLRKFVAPEFLFGADASALVGQYAANLSVSKALVVTDPNLKSLSPPTAIIEHLREEGIEAALYADVSPNPRAAEVMAGAQLFADEQCDAIIAVGGGSPMDCAKAIGIVCTNGKHIVDFEGVDKVTRPGPPLICIPTTAGSAADVSQFCIITAEERHVKIAIVSKTMIPDVALIDPMLTMTMSPELTAHTGLDALTHAIEAYVSNASSAFTDLNALEAVRLVGKHLPTAVNEPNNIEARSGMMLGSTYAGLAFSNAILGAVHAMAHSLGGVLDLPHGLCNAILLDHVIEFNFDAVPDKYHRLAMELDPGLTQSASREEAKASLMASIRDLKQAVGISVRLGELGVTEKDLDLLARNSLEDACMLTNPKQATYDDVARIFKQAF